MDALAVWATMQVREGREDDARAFLEEAGRRIEAGEPGTTSFQALDMGGGRFAILNTFRDEAAFRTHVEGPVAAWVQESNADLFVAPYDIARLRPIASHRR